MGTLLNGECSKTNCLPYSKYFVAVCTLAVFDSVVQMEYCASQDPNKVSLYLTL